MRKPSKKSEYLKLKKDMRSRVSNDRARSQIAELRQLFNFEKLSKITGINDASLRSISSCRSRHKCTKRNAILIDQLYRLVMPAMRQYRTIRDELLKF